MSDGQRPVDFVMFRGDGALFAIEARLVQSMQPAEGDAPARLTLSTGPGSIEVEAPVELASIAPEDIHPLPPAVASRCAIRGLKAFAQRDGGLMLVLDPRRL